MSEMNEVNEISEIDQAKKYVGDNIEYFQCELYDVDGWIEGRVLKEWRLEVFNADLLKVDRVQELLNLDPQCSQSRFDDVIDAIISRMFMLNINTCIGHINNLKPSITAPRRYLFDLLLSSKLYFGYKHSYVTKNLQNWLYLVNPGHMPVNFDVFDTHNAEHCKIKLANSYLKYNNHVVPLDDETSFIWKVIVDRCEYDAYFNYKKCTDLIGPYLKGGFGINWGKMPVIEVSKYTKPEEKRNIGKLIDYLVSAGLKIDPGLIFI